jgi:hypothetical protein
MSTERKGVEFLVGLFLAAGLIAIAAIVVMFGRLGRAIQEAYEITVQFPNASGIVKGSEVLLSGASIGNPHLRPARGFVRRCHHAADFHRGGFRAAGGKDRGHADDGL